MSSANGSVVEDKKSSSTVLKASGLRAALAQDGIAAGLLAQGGSAFESVQDFSKLNSGRHQASRADTFKTPPALVKPFSGAQSARRDDSKGMTRDLLEIFEMGVARNMANLRNEVRDELQQATESLRTEVLAAIADTRGLTMLGVIDKKVDEIKQGPVTVNFSAVLKEIRSCHTATREAVQNATQGILRQIAQSSSKLNEEMIVSLQRQDDSLRGQCADLLRSAEEVAHKLEETTEATVASTERFRESFGKTMNEVRKMQEENRRHHDKVEKAGAQMLQRDNALADLVRDLQPELSKISEVQRNLELTYKETRKEVQHIQKESTQYHAKLVPCLQAEFSRHFAAHSVSVDLTPVMRQLGRTEQTLSNHFPQLLTEISKIQQAVNVDFIPTEDLAQYQSSSGLFIEYTSMTIDSEDQEVKDGESSREAQVKSPSTMRIILPMAVEDQSDEETDVVVHHPTTVERSVSRQSNIGVPALKRTDTQSLRRVRHYWAQTEALVVYDAWMQTDEIVVEKKALKKGMSPRAAMVTRPPPPAKKTDRGIKPVFADSEAMQQRARQALLRPQLKITDLYHTTGVSQKIARSTVFEYSTLVIIFMNAIWIAIDVDYNKANILLEAHPAFQVGENFFCLYFTWELIIRFLAFKHKQDIVKDKWFMFDCVLVLFMIIETWVITIVMLAAGVRSSANLGSMSMLRMVRMVKMLRISRMARLLRGIPELLILLKGIKAASRSVVIFFALWLIITYIYALMFRILVDNETSTYFGTMGQSMNTLLLMGILPDHATLVNSVTAENVIFWPLMVSFVALASVTLMNMLVGVLVEVVSAIAKTEKEGITVLALATDLRLALTTMGVSAEVPLPREEVEKIITDPDCAHVIEQAGADVLTLADMLPQIFEDQHDGCLKFEDLVEAILNMRGSNPAKVKDVKGQLRALKNAIKETEMAVRSAISDDLHDLRTELYEMRMSRLENESFHTDD